MESKLKMLSPEEKDLLFKATALVSLLASSSDGEIFEIEKADAIKLAHLRTFTSDPMLHEYYAEVEKIFERNLEELNNVLPKTQYEREKAITKELEKINHILPKLGKEYSKVFQDSLNSYAKHVSHAHRNAVEFFFIPIDIQGITD